MTEISFRQLIADAHKVAADHGFWDDDYSTRTMMLAEKIALIHSEASEALEALRAGEPDYWVRYGNDPKAGKPEGIVSELIDVIIRAADTLGYIMPPDEVEMAYTAKVNYNKSRGYKHGKKF